VHRTFLSLLTVSLAVAAVVVGVNYVRGGSSSPKAGADTARLAAGASPLECAPGWVAAWNASPVAAPGGRVAQRPEVGGRTLRMIVRPRAAGSEVRLVLSNRYGAQPLELRSVSVAPAGSGPDLAGKPVTARFGGLAAAWVPAKGQVISDPVDLPASAANSLAVSMFVVGKPAVVSEHPWAMRTSYISDPGDFADSRDGARFTHPVTSWLILTGLDVRAPKATNAVALMGDSITDGVGSSLNTDRRLSDSLSDRLTALGGAEEMSVLNAGIAGNQLLADFPSTVGESVLSRFGWEVAGRPGVTDVILHAGTNDLAAGASAQDVIAGMTRFTERSHTAGMRVFLTTITPANTGTHGSPAVVAKRNEVNQWVRSQGRAHADGVFDFAAAVTDVSQPGRLTTGFDAGDGLHLSDLGYRALAGAVELGALSGSRCLA
jgi:lysophospholipase L1-like esterase